MTSAEHCFPTPILVAEIPSTTARQANGDKFQTPLSQQEAMSRLALSLVSPRHWYSLCTPFLLEV
jgi:hypothetical protein